MSSSYFTVYMSHCKATVSNKTQGLSNVKDTNNLIPSSKKKPSLFSKNKKLTKFAI